MKPKNLDKVLEMFGRLWLVTAVGLLMGQFLPQTLTIIAGPITLILIFLMIFIRPDRKTGSILGYSIAFLLGVTLSLFMKLMVGFLGFTLTITVVVACIVVFAGAGLFGYRLKKDLTGLGNFLSIVLLALVIFTFVTLLIDFNMIVMMILAVIAVLIFIGYTVYDFNQLSHMGDIDEDEVPLLAVNLYLDLLNFIIQGLKLVYYAIETIVED